MSFLQSSPQFLAPVYHPCITFWYHAWSSNKWEWGELTLDSRSEASWGLGLKPSKGLRNKTKDQSVWISLGQKVENVIRSFLFRDSRPSVQCDLLKIDTILLTLLSPKFAIKRVSLTATTATAVVPSFHDGLLQCDNYTCIMCQIKCNNQEIRYVSL